ncbi:hypothetical protein QR680_016989 [Steinernema hermaphroditum]|uniref:DBC1/CARP1 catalytically inactive NUDIX hydrolase domain-containing protein n=1 Tax=Steinernema hermaphroditum TaxID=289476 RepID=A0AA39LNI8_9BILA|nr:hypothetical protein QR680_016989 [Steinernema hermaphroditum]
MMGPGGGQPFGMPGLPPGLGGLVNAAAFQSLNMNAMAQQAAAVRAMQQQQQQQQAAAAGQSAKTNQRTFIGTVTKMHETYGFVDDDVFFQVSVVRGGPIHTGDRVMVEASYNPSMPFNTVQRQASPQPMETSLHLLTAALDSLQDAGHHKHQLLLISSQYLLKGHWLIVVRTAQEVLLDIVDRQWRGNLPLHDECRLVAHHLGESVRGGLLLLEHKSEKENVLPTRRARVNQRYHCSTPKAFIGSMAVTASMIRNRYQNMYIPSDFCQLQVFWPKSFPLGVSLPMSPTPVTFDILHKDVDVPVAENEQLILDASDADSRYMVKVLLMAHQGLTAVQQRAFGLMPDGTVDENADPVSVTRILNFLVGVRGKNEVMAIGGAWSPSLDGESPMDPQTQIRTAVRCTKAMIGVDLSSCSRWFKMVQLRYFRGSSSGSGGRIDNVTLLLPDTSSSGARLQPSTEDYAATRALLQEQLRTRLAAIDAEEFVEQAISSYQECNTAAASSSASSLPPTSASTVDGDTNVTTTEPQLQGEEQKKPTHFSVLVNDLLTIDVDAIKSELEARKNLTEGEEEDLRNKLKELVEKEAAAHEEEIAAKKAKFEENKAQRKTALERHFVIPENPTVLVYPSKTAKGGKLECKTVSLQSMLEYRSDDNKESSFEVFLFAEAVKELLERDFAFTIYRSLFACNDKEEETKKREETLATPTADDAAAATAEEKEKKENEKAKKFKSTVGNRALFAAYSHFDSTAIGYLLERDVDEIVQSIGIDISRADIHRLTKKVLTSSSTSSRDRIISYRTLTDVYVDSEGAVKYAPTQLDIPTDEELAKGHSAVYETAASETEPLSHIETPDVTATGVVQYKGVLVNLGENMEQLKRVEDERNGAIAKADELEFQLKNVKERRDYLEKKKKRLEDDVDRYRKRMHEAEKNLKNSQDDVTQLKTTLLDCRKMCDRVVYAVDKAIPREKPAKKEDGTSASKEKSVEQGAQKEGGDKDKQETKEEKAGEEASHADDTQPVAEQAPEIADGDANASQESGSAEVEEMNIMEVDAVEEEEPLQIDDEVIVLAEEVGAED